MKRKLETLAERLAIFRRNGLPCGNVLEGCPEGGWAETRQAIMRLRDEIPRPDCRDYTIWQLIAALYDVDSADRYRRREEASR